MTNILIIEDDEQTRENLELILEMENFSVCSAADGKAGIVLARQTKPDLIVCDVSLPGLNGHELLGQIRADAEINGIPFIFLTARGERADQRAGMNLGADDYLCKPVDAEDLLATIRTRLRRRQQNHAATLRDAEFGVNFSSAVPLETLGLTPREAEVLLWVAQGKTNSDTATILGMSEKTVRIHLGHIFEKLNVETRTAAALVTMEKLAKSTVG